MKDRKANDLCPLCGGHKEAGTSTFSAERLQVEVTTPEIPRIGGFQLVGTSRRLVRVRDSDARGQRVPTPGTQSGNFCNDTIGGHS